MLDMLGLDIVDEGAHFIFTSGSHVRTVFAIECLGNFVIALAWCIPFLRNPR